MRTSGTSNGPARTRAHFGRPTHRDSIDAGRHGSDAGGPARAKLFARKFDMDLDRVVLDRLDAELLGVRA